MVLSYPSRPSVNIQTYSRESRPTRGGVSGCNRLGKPIPVIAFEAKGDFAYRTTVSAMNQWVKLNECNTTADTDWLTIDKNYTETVCRDEPFSIDPTLVPCNTITETSLTKKGETGIEPTVCKRWDGCKDGVTMVFCDLAPSDRHGPNNSSVDAHILYSNASSVNTPSVAWRFFKSFW